MTPTTRTAAPTKVIDIKPADQLRLARAFRTLGNSALLISAQFQSGDVKNAIKILKTQTPIIEGARENVMDLLGDIEDILEESK